MKLNISKEQYIELWNLKTKEICRTIETEEIAKRLNRDNNGRFYYYDKSLLDIIFKDLRKVYERITVRRILRDTSIPEFDCFEINEENLTIEFINNG